MEDLNWTGGDNMGGLLQLKFTPIENVEAPLPDVFNNVISEAVTLKDGAQWHEVKNFRQDTGQMMENPQETESGTIYKPEVKCVIGGDDSSRSANIEEMKRHRHLVLATDQQGNTFLLGTLKNPMHFSFEKDSGEGFAGFNGYRISFKSKKYQAQRAPFYEPQDTSGSGS